MFRGENRNIPRDRASETNSTHSRNVIAHKSIIKWTYTMCLRSKNFARKMMITKCYTLSSAPDTRTMSMTLSILLYYIFFYFSCIRRKENRISDELGIGTTSNKISLVNVAWNTQRMCNVFAFRFTNISFWFNPKRKLNRGLRYISAKSTFIEGLFLYVYIFIASIYIRILRYAYVYRNWKTEPNRIVVHEHEHATQ